MLTRGVVLAVLGLAACDRTCEIDPVLDVYTSGADLLDCGNLEDGDPLFPARDCVIEAMVSEEPFVARWDYYGLENFREQRAWLGRNVLGRWTVYYFSSTPDYFNFSRMQVERCRVVYDLGGCQDERHSLCLECGGAQRVESCYSDQ